MVTGVKLGSICASSSDSTVALLTEVGDKVGCANIMCMLRFIEDEQDERSSPRGRWFSSPQPLDLTVHPVRTASRSKLEAEDIPRRSRASILSVEPVSSQRQVRKHLRDSTTAEAAQPTSSQAIRCPLADPMAVSNISGTSISLKSLAGVERKRESGKWKIGLPKRL